MIARIKLHLNVIKLIIDLTYCTAAYFILLGIFSGSTQIEMVDHIYTSIFLGTLIVASTINTWFVTPAFLNRKKYLAWVIVFFLNAVACTYFNYVLFDKLIDFILPGYFFISYYDFFDLFKFFFVFLSLLTLLHMSYEWFQLQ